MQLNIGPDLATLKGKHLAEINSLASDKILAVVPIWKQSNLTARAIELQSIGEANWTQGELQEWQSAQSTWSWIKSVRSLSNDYYQNVVNAPSPKDVYDAMINYKVALAEL